MQNQENATSQEKSKTKAEMLQVLELPDEDLE